jgi:hypothetical protein
MVGQNCWKNSIGKPSGPAALSFGRSKTAFFIFAREIGYVRGPRWSMLNWVYRLLRLGFILHCIGVPSSSLLKLVDSLRIFRVCVIEVGWLFGL